MDIVIIHGFSSLRGEERLKLLIEKIKQGLPTTNIIVPNYLERYGIFSKIRAGRKSIAEYAKLCQSVIIEKGASGPLIMIGYSLGGLIARVLVEKRIVRAKAVILVGTPNKGIKLSKWERLLLKIFKRPCLEEMEKSSEFLRGLNEGPILNNYYYIGGRIDKQVPLNSSMPWEILEDTKKYLGAAVIEADHSGLIPTKRIDGSAIPIIIKVLKKELKIKG